MQCQSASHHARKDDGSEPKSRLYGCRNCFVGVCFDGRLVFSIFVTNVGTKWIWIEPGLERPCSIIQYRILPYYCTIPKTKWCHPGRNIKTSLTFSVGTAPRTNPHGPCFQRCAGCKRWADEVVATIPKKVLKSNMSTGPLKLKRSKTYL